MLTADLYLLMFYCVWMWYGHKTCMEFYKMCLCAKRNEQLNKTKRTTMYIFRIQQNYLRQKKTLY